MTGHDPLWLLIFALLGTQHRHLDRGADGFRVVARAPDGTIEGLERQGHPWLLAVQWHPELTAASEPSQQRLFDALVRAAGGARIEGP